MVTPRIVLDCLSRAMVAVAAMLSIAILAGNPPLETPARATAATLLALGTFGLLALSLVAPARSTAHPRR